MDAVTSSRLFFWIIRITAVEKIRSQIVYVKDTMVQQPGCQQWVVDGVATPSIVASVAR